MPVLNRKNIVEMLKDLISGFGEIPDPKVLVGFMECYMFFNKDITYYVVYSNEGKSIQINLEYKNGTTKDIALEDLV